jgi:mono/diheme cytochrome c family protein
MIRFACPSCLHVYDLSDRQAGTKFRCDLCGQRLQVPAPPAGVPDVPPTRVAGGSAPRRRSSVAGVNAPPAAYLRLVMVGCGLLALAGAILWVLAGFSRPRSAIPPTAPSSPPSLAPAPSTLAHSTPTPAPDASPTPEQDPGTLAQEAREILARYCYRCHGQDGAAEGGFNYILDRDRLVARRKLVPGQAQRSRLFRRVRQGEMPPPEEAPRPGPDQVAVLRRWIDAGAPSVPAPEPRVNFLTHNQLATLIRDDLFRLPERERRFARYFTLTHLANAGLSRDELQTYRLALAKVVNSLSWNREVINPRPIDPERTILRIDIRDYSWNDRLWADLLSAYPHQLLPETAEARASVEAAEGQLPYIRADWFLAFATRPPLYHEMLQLPDQEAALEAQLHIDLRQDIRQERVARTGFNGSGVSRNNRLVERHASPHGAYWRSYDFASNVGRRNLFAHPLGPGREDTAFEPDGGEVIFNLPNGLHAFLLIDGRGRRVDKAPLAIVSDPRRPDRAVENGVSCMTCHARGLIPKDDQVRAHVEGNAGAFSQPELEAVRALYPPKGDLAALLTADNERYRRAVEQTGGQMRATESIATLVQQYERALDITTAASELGLQPDELSRRLKDAPDLARELGPLRVPGGTVQRQVFDDAFPAVVRDLGLGILVAPEGRSR